MTIADILEEPLLIAGVEETSRRKRVSELLGQVQLGSKLSERFPAELSGGQRQRVAIARAIALKPEILIADEPVSSLDPATRETVLDLLIDLTRNLGHTLVLIAHDLAVVRAACDDCAVMWRGRLVERSSAEDLFRRAIHPYTRLLLAAAAMKDEPTLDLGPIPDLREVEPGHWAAI
jgi:ABC-type glutathione transport system ATPase component